MYNLLVLQVNLADVQFDAIENENPIAGLIPVFMNLLLAVAAVLAILSAYRIFHNYHTGQDTIMRGSMRLVLGMIAVLVVRMFITQLV